MSGLNIDKLKLADAVNLLFDISLSKYPKIKTPLTSLVRSNVIKGFKEKPQGGIYSRGQSWIYRDQLNLLHNAVILLGLVSSTRIIKKILNGSGNCEDRHRLSDFSRLVLVERQSIVGISLLREEVILFIEMLASDTDLAKNRLPNPFKTLPQLVLPEAVDTIQALLAQSTVLSNGDTMMAHYLNGDLEKAWQAAQQLDFDDHTLGQYKTLIEKEYAEAKEFDELLDFLT